MKKLSSDKTFLHKTVYPVFMLAIALVMLGILVGYMFREQQFSLLVVGFIGLAMVYVYTEYRKRAVGLVDEVWDDGDSLLVKNGDQQERIAIANIAKIKYGGIGNSHFVLLTLHEPCVFGNELRFVPPRKVFQFFKNRAVVDLAIRIKKTAGEVE